MGPHFLFLLTTSGLLAIATPLNVAVPSPNPAITAPNSALVGAWRLISYVDTPEGGDSIYAFGKQPIGQFLFTADGQISISIMRNPPDLRTATTDIDPDACLSRGDPDETSHCLT